MEGVRMNRPRSALGDRGFTLVEFLAFLALVPLVIAISFSAVWVVMGMHKLAGAQSSVSTAAMVVMETLGQDLRGMKEIRDDSSSTCLRGRLQDDVTEVTYEFTPPGVSQPGMITRNGARLFGSGLSVTSCEFTYLVPGPGGALQETSDVGSASSVKVRFVVEQAPASAGFEAVFNLRNL
ncbi:MAG: hypothetical protein NUW12_11100 [Firmicutes bacterium]|nr:hypothetical protein [Bacillota bacterium]MDH7496556.1 hypothetical protein [Bacillota bacterium]